VLSISVAAALALGWLVAGLIRRPVVAVRMVPSPGRYDDGTSYVQVNKVKAWDAWPRPGYDVKVGEPWSFDAEHDYVPAHNSHSAYVYTRWMCQEGVPASALTVVRLDRSGR